MRSSSIHRWRSVELGMMRSLVRMSALLALAACVAHPAQAQLGLEQPASLVVYPYIVANAADGLDTILQLSNATDLAVDVRCMYENANGHCSGSGAVCEDDEDCPEAQGCEPGFAATTFDIRLTARQPIGWQASEGLAALPVAGNEGAIPALPELPFRGSLRCFATDAAGVPIATDALLGLATIERFVAGPPEQLDVAKYVALGARGEGALTDDGRLLLGGPDAEYEGCPNVLEFQSPFSPAFDPGLRLVETTLVLLPCSVFYGDGRPAQAEVSYLIFNEFGERRQRATPLSVDGLLVATLDAIDPLLYSSAGQGTAAGKTRLTSSGSGLVGLLLETHFPRSAARALHHQGERVTADVISFVETAGCAGDCNGDGRVDVAEVVNAVSISLGAPVALCNAADTDQSGSVVVTELIAAVNSLLGGCP